MPPEPTPQEFVDQLRAQGQHDKAVNLQYNIDRLALEEGVANAQVMLANAETTGEQNAAQEALADAQAKLQALGKNPIHQREEEARQMLKDAQEKRKIAIASQGTVSPAKYQSLLDEADRAYALAREHETKPVYSIGGDAA